MDHVFSISRTRSYTEFKQDNTVDVEPPILVSPQNTPQGAGIGQSTATPLGGVVNVVRDFYWTQSKALEGRQEVPKIILSEKRLKSNALISQLKYAFGVTRDNIGGIVKNLPTNLSNRLQKWGSKQITALTESDTGQAVTDFYNAQNYLQDNNDVYKENPYLIPYQNLYITEPTGWEFILPYFDNYNNAALNAFSNDIGSSTGLSFLKSAVDIATDIADITSVLRSPTQITFVEKAKFYNYPVEGEEFSFTFPLINTGSATFNDVVKNWELLFLLLYNNKPSRKNVSVIDPPVIYQVEIPGVKFLPFCYISNISVDFAGSRRQIDFNLNVTENLNVDASTPVTGPTRPGEAIPDVVVRYFNNSPGLRKINTIVPDAYAVKVTIKSLLPETKNFMYTVLNKGNLVSTRKLGAGVDDFLNPFVGSSAQNSNAPTNNPNNTNNPPLGIPSP